MPYPDADRLKCGGGPRFEGRNAVSFSAGDYIEWKQRTMSFQDMLAWMEELQPRHAEQPEMGWRPGGESWIFIACHGNRVLLLGARFLAGGGSAGQRPARHPDS